MNPYPLKFEPIYKEKVWGGRSLAKLGRNLPGSDDTLVGESWELADLGTTSASGGGGGAERSVITNGPLAGQTLHDAMGQLGESLLGKLPLNEAGEFPLLVKFLDANDNLSVQVHPSPEYAAEHDDAYLKSEAWYVLDCAPGAAIYKGVKEGTTPDQFARAIKDDTVEPLMIKVPVKPGDCHYLPSGTCHALGQGVLVAEVQTPSDTTFRVYDWGRTGRELHIEQALACIEFGPAQTGEFEQRSEIVNDAATITHLVTCDYFRIERVTIAAGHEGDLPVREPTVWMVLHGSGTIAPGNGRDAVEYTRGDTLLLPADMPNGQLKVTGDLTALEVTFPQAKPSTLA